MIAYHYGYRTDHMTAMTMAFSTLSLARLFHGFNCRSHHSIVRIGFRKNRYSLWAFAAGVFLLGIVLLVPGMHGIFSVAKLNITAYGMILLLSALPTILIQLVRLLRENMH